MVAVQMADGDLLLVGGLGEGVLLLGGDLDVLPTHFEFQK